MKFIDYNKQILTEKPFHSNRQEVDRDAKFITILFNLKNTLDISFGYFF